LKEILNYQKKKFSTKNIKLNKKKITKYTSQQRNSLLKIQLNHFRAKEAIKWFSATYIYEVSQKDL
jgi:hypothetical protein